MNYITPRLSQGRTIKPYQQSLRECITDGRVLNIHQRRFAGDLESDIGALHLHGEI
jgi:hypothetical protein